MDQVPSAIIETKNRAKDLFKQGQINISFRVLNDELIRMAKNLGDHFSHQYALLVVARLRMEVGDYSDADEALTEVQSIFTQQGKVLQESNNTLYQYIYCKYYHILGKNKARSYYFEKSKDVFEEGIEFLNKYHPALDDSKIKNKYLCKLYEGLGLLYCEALWFEKSEAYFKLCEEIYAAKRDAPSSYQFLQFKLKKAALMKREGFF